MSCSNDSDVHRCSFPGDVLVPRTKFLQEQIQNTEHRFPSFLLSRNALPVASAANTSAWRIWTNLQELEFLAPLSSQHGCYKISELNVRAVFAGLEVSGE